jgi:sugar/nucleoside kinase (ribokinase family)
MQESILVLGGAHIDRRGRISGETVPGASNPGGWFEEAGGGGFNAARNLARLGHAVSMISPRGGDREGETVAEAAEAAGVADHPFTFLDRRTPSYTAILEADGNLVIALADMELYTLFTPRRLQMRQIRARLEAASHIVCDANLPAETIAAIAAQAAASGAPLAGIAISPAKVRRYKAVLPMIDRLFLNEAEAEVIAGFRPENPDVWPKALRQAGLKGGAVTRGSRPAYLFGERHAVRLTPPPAPAISDVTGAGDSFAAGVLAAEISGLPPEEAIRRGVAAALITLASPLACAPELSPQALEAMLDLVPAAEILS